jgi:hypothetical protein
LRTGFKSSCFSPTFLRGWCVIMGSFIISGDACVLRRIQYLYLNGKSLLNEVGRHRARRFEKLCIILDNIFYWFVFGFWIMVHLFPSLPVLVVPSLNNVALAGGAFRVLETM